MAEEETKSEDVVLDELGEPDEPLDELERDEGEVIESAEEELNELDEPLDELEIDDKKD